MLRTLLLCAFMLIFLNDSVIAEIFKCRDAEGTLVFTNDPSRFPPGCDAEPVGDLPPLNIMPSQSASPVKPSSSATTTERDQRKNVGRSFDSLKDDAAHLVGQFESARQEVYRPGFEKNKQKARRELTVIRSRKERFLDELDQSELNRSQKQEIQKTLSKITE